MKPQSVLVGPRVRWFIVSSTGVILLCLFGDHLVRKWEVLFVHVRAPLTRTVSKALVDNVVHATVAGWSWFNTWLVDTTLTWNRVVALQVLCCTVLGSIMDLDHFIQAASLDIQDAVHLSHRPFLHNTTLILVLTLLLFICVYVLSRVGLCPSFLYDIPAMFLVSCLSHQLRDSTRRGVWLAPLGTLPPHKLYLLLVAGLPLIMVPLRRRQLLLCPHKHTDNNPTLSLSGV